MKDAIATLFAPGEKDVEYVQTEQLRISLIFRMDSYKFSHPFAYKAGIKGMTSYGTARVSPKQVIVPFGMQLLVKRYLTETITMADVDAAEAFSIAHFGRKLFAREAWEKVVNVYGGKLPLIIRAVPEGMKVRGGDPIYTCTVIDEDVYWMATAFETLMQRGVWYPTTIATNDYETKRDIYQHYVDTGADMNLLPFAVHDFGGRGVTVGEQAETGGASHTVSFMGSDTVEGILTANFYYKSVMSAFSVYATEHSVECSFGLDEQGELEYLRHQIRKAKALGLPIVSIVIDGKDVYRAAQALCTGALRDEIIASGLKVVFRPDSGDMMEVVPRILHMQEMAFGSEPTSRGFRRIKHVGIIQGDGVDRLAINSLLGKITNLLGFSADCVIFGSGGALLQKVNRDTFKFAQKASAMLTDEGWVGMAKDPVTDAGKKSLEGVLTLVRSRMNNELMIARLDCGPLNSEWEDQMKLVYHTGKLYNETTLDEVRARVA